MLSVFAVKYGDLESIKVSNIVMVCVDLLHGCVVREAFFEVKRS